MIEDSLSKRKHVMHYDTEIIPTESEIKEILEIGYSLATSKMDFSFISTGESKNSN